MSIHSIPRIIISSDRSSSGKTTISIGIMTLLTKLGYSVQPFKVALDYIDPQYHSYVTNRKSKNIDGYLMNDREIIDVFLHACESKDIIGKKADIAIIEGVRGLYEGIDSINDIGSTAQISKVLDAPIIFVINAKSMTKSCAALIKGFSSFDSNIKIKGIILNNIGTEKHAKKAIEAINHYTSIPVIGVLYRNENIKLEMRDLGLKTIPEQLTLSNEYKLKMDNISKVIENNIDINKIIKIATNTKPIITKDETSIFKKKINSLDYFKIRIGIPYDEAFNFYYEDNIDIFLSYGVSIIKFSILHDNELPNDIQALYIGSGNIEYFLNDLEKNISMRNSIKKASINGMPIYGESSGMNYLTEKIIYYNSNNNKKEYEMVGALPGNTIIDKKDRTVTYSNGIFTEDSIIGNKNDAFKAHEFHNTKMKNIPKDAKYAIKINRGFGIVDLKDGIMKHNTIGTYLHFHGVSYRLWINNIIESAIKYKTDILKEK